MKMNLYVKRTPLKGNNNTSTCQYVKALLILSNEHIGLICPSDTLALVFEPIGEMPYREKRSEYDGRLSRDEWHNNELYWVQTINKDGFIIFLVPMENRENRYGIIVSTSNICNN